MGHLEYWNMTLAFTKEPHIIIFLNVLNSKGKNVLGAREVANTKMREG